MKKIIVILVICQALISCTAIQKQKNVTSNIGFESNMPKMSELSIKKENQEEFIAITEKEEASIILNSWNKNPRFSKKDIEKDKEKQKLKNQNKWKKGKDKKYNIDDRKLF